MIHKCLLCHRRDRDAGGNGSCPMVSRRSVFQTKTGTDVLETHAEAFTRHLETFSTQGCLNFKAGDLRPRLTLVPQESLF